MVKLFESLVAAWCWLRVAASPVVIGAALGAGAYLVLEGVWRFVAGGAFVLLGLYYGARLANFARRKNLLPEFAAGLPPGKGAPGDEGVVSDK